MALAIAACKDWEVLQLDIQTAFVNVEVHEEVNVTILQATNHPTLHPDVPM